MNYLDFGVIAIILIFLVRGIWVGFIRQLASLAALILGYIFAGRYYEQISPYLSSLISSPQLRFLVTYVLLFLVVFGGVLVLGFLLKKVVSLSLLGWFDRFLGAIFGLVKAVLISTVCFMVLSGLLAEANPLLNGSFAAPYLAKSSGVLLSLVRDHNLRSLLLPKNPAITIPAPSVPDGQPIRVEPAKKSK